MNKTKKIKNDRAEAAINHFYGEIKKITDPNTPLYSQLYGC